jgi:hypothetical protein
MPRKYSMPHFLEGIIEPELYERWLTRKAIAHVRRDRGRERNCTVAHYKQAIHEAVCSSEGNDAYTGEPLRWNLIGTYKNEDSKKGRHGYKAGFALLPTVDHVSSQATEASFRICGWRTNDAKNDLSTEAFIELCEKVLSYAGYEVKRRG